MSLRLLTSLFVLALLAFAAAADETVTVFSDVPVGWNPDGPAVEEREGYVARSHGQVIERHVTFPAAPADLKDARRIIAIIDVKPVILTEGDARRIADPWTRLGSVAALFPGVPGGENETQKTVELIRFVTGFGGPGTFEQDVTAYAPALGGEVPIRCHISTWTPAGGWLVSLRFEFRDSQAGYRRPAFLDPLLSTETITAERSKRSAKVTIEEGLALPRLHLISTGHGAQQEFVSSTHVLRIDGREILRWRPWREGGGALHDANPTSGRRNLGGRELWSSDIDRSGWLPGEIVRPLRVPLPELTPGEHTIELEILDIYTSPDEGQIDGYWVTSMTLVADEPWPQHPPDQPPPAGNSGR